MANLSPRFANSCSLFGLREGSRDTRYRGFSHPSLVGGPRVPLHFRQARMAADGADLVFGASGLCEPPTGGFAQPMRGTVLRQPGLVAPLPEQIAEAGS